MFISITAKSFFIALALIPFKVTFILYTDYILFSSFLFELFSTMGTGNVDFSLSRGNSQGAMALRTVEISVVFVLKLIVLFKKVLSPRLTFFKKP